MSNYTLTFNDDSQGWPSFYSYFPEYIIGMNAYLYTFRNGNLYRHNTNNQRNTFYGAFTNSSITSVFNPFPTKAIKLFKTLSYESTTEDADPNQARWDCVRLITDLSQGNVDDLNFVRKEGEWYAYVRHNDGVTNFALRYANGLGAVNGAPTGPATALVVSLSQTITIDTTVAGATAPVDTNFILFVNDTVAESYGMRGYYMEFKLENDSDKPVELYSVGSSMMKSYP